MTLKRARSAVVITSRLLAGPARARAVLLPACSPSPVDMSPSDSSVPSSSSTGSRGSTREREVYDGWMTYAPASFMDSVGATRPWDGEEGGAGTNPGRTLTSGDTVVPGARMEGEAASSRVAAHMASSSRRGVHRYAAVPSFLEMRSTWWRWMDATSTRAPATSTHSAGSLRGSSLASRWLLARASMANQRDRPTSTSTSHPTRMASSGASCRAAGCRADTRGDRKGCDGGWGGGVPDRGGGPAAVGPAAAAMVVVERSW